MGRKAALLRSSFILSPSSFVVIPVTRCPGGRGNLFKVKLFVFILSGLLWSSSPVAFASDAPVQYRNVRPSDAKWKRAKKSYGKSADLLLAKINRVDLKRLKRQSSLVVPDRPVDILDCSPFPQTLTEVANWPKLVLVSRRVQAFGAYERGRLVRWGPTSTGVKEQPTPEHLYFTSWKSRRKTSSLDRSWIMPWYVNLHTSMGVAFHQYSLPGRPFSHGCIRLLKDDAIWMYRWTDEWVPNEDRITARVYGTPVIVFGDFEYDKTPPWKRLPKDPRATDVTLEELEPPLENYRTVIEERARAREGLEGPQGPQGPKGPKGGVTSIDACTRDVTPPLGP